MSRLIRVIGILCCAICLITACEYDGPNAIWKPNPTGAPDPVIQSIVPENTAGPGAAKIVIQGENFSSEEGENMVFFDNVQVDVKEFSPTELVVYRPNLTAENIVISVVVQDALQESKFSPYAVTPVGGVYAEVREKGTLNAMAVDKDENVWIHTNRKKLYRVNLDGSVDEVITNTRPRTIYEMKLGPDGVLYLGRDDKYMMLARPGADDLETWASGLPGKVKYFDFDPNQNIYAGGKGSGMIIIYPDGSNFKLDDYANYDIYGIRYFDQTLYIAASYLGDDGLGIPFGIYISKVKNDLTLEKPELLLDWAESGSFSETTFMDMEMDEDGILYIATDGGEGFDLDPIMMIYPDGSLDTFYKGGILSGPIMGVAWGEGGYLYYFTSLDPSLYYVHRIDMAKQCAPRYGR